jgi:hypothetical protein
VFIALFQSCSRGLKDVDFFRITAVVFQWYQFNPTTVPHPRSPVQGHILSVGGGDALKETFQNTQGNWDRVCMDGWMDCIIIPSS